MPIDVAMPMLAPTRRSRPRTAIGSLTSSMMRRAIAVRSRDLTDRWAEHRELVAAEPADEVAAPEGGGQAPGHDAQHLVADGVAVLVVDGLEPVEIDVEQPDHRVVAGRGERGSERLEEAGPVGDLGERIAAGGALERLALAAPLEHERQHPTHDLERVAVDRRRRTDGARPPDEHRRVGVEGVGRRERPSTPRARPRRPRPAAARAACSGPRSGSRRRCDGLAPTARRRRGGAGSGATTVSVPVTWSSPSTSVVEHGVLLAGMAPGPEHRDDLEQLGVAAVGGDELEEAVLQVVVARVATDHQGVADRRAGWRVAPR